MPLIYSRFAFAFALLLLALLPAGAEAAKDVKLLLLFPSLNNPESSSDYHIKGIKMALADRPDWKSRVQLLPVETGETAKQIAETSLRAIEQHKPDLIYGALTSNAAFVISEIAEMKKVPFITASATHPDITRNRQYTFRTCFDDQLQASRLADFSFKVKSLRKALVLFNVNETYSVGMKKIFQTRFQELGGEVVKSIGYQSDKDFDSEMVSSITDLDFDFVFLPGYQVESAAIVSSILQALKRKVIFVGGDGWGGSELFQNLLKGNQEHFQGYYVDHWSVSEPQNRSQEFLLKLKQQKNIPPRRYVSAALGFDSMNVMILALEKSGDLRKALRQVNHQGVTGHIHYPGQSQTPDKEIFLFELSASGNSFVRSYR